MFVIFLLGISMTLQRKPCIYRLLDETKALSTDRFPYTLATLIVGGNLRPSVSAPFSPPLLILSAPFYPSFQVLDGTADALITRIGNLARVISLNGDDSRGHHGLFGRKKHKSCI